jgi:hypothetical protein
MQWDACIGTRTKIMVSSTGMSWKHVCLPLKSYLVDVDDQVVA